MKYFAGKYFSFRRQAFLAVGAALIAFSTPPALHAQSVSYQQGGQQNNGSTYNTVVHPIQGGPQPGPGPVTTMHPINSMGPGQGPVVYYTPPIMQGSAPSTGWGGQGYNQGQYNPGYGQRYNQGPSYGQTYPHVPYGQTYQPPVQRQMYTRQPVHQPIPDAISAGAPAPGLSQGGFSPAPSNIFSVVVTPPRFVQTDNDSDGRHHNHGDNFLGGFYFGNYVDNFDGAGSYLSAYSYYPGVPEYIYEPNGSVVVFDPPVVSPYVGNYIDFDMPAYMNSQIEDLYQYQQLATTDNPFLYHGPAVLPNPYAPPPAPAPSQDQQQQQQAAPPPADQQPAPAPAVQQPAAPQYQPGTYKEAFADIESAWINGDIDSIRKHLRDNDLKIAVSLNGKYSYSIASGDWADITRDALDHLQTDSFQFTLLRFQKNGDITGYAKHDYTAESKDGEKQDTMYLSYTLRHRDKMWYIVEVDTSTKPLIPEQKDQPASDDQSAPATTDKN